MFAYEIWLLDGSVYSENGFETKYAAEVAMYDLIDAESLSVDFVKVWRLDYGS